MRLILDRFENDIAVLQDEANISYLISRSLLPENISDGTVILMSENAFSVDENEKVNRMKKNSALFKKLQKKSCEYKDGE